jgi:predicted dehydrogenase
MKKIRWGVIGLGIGLLHAKTLKTLPNSELVAVCDTNIPTLERAKEELGSIAYHSDGLKMLEEENLDAIAIATFGSFRTMSKFAWLLSLTWLLSLC